MKISISHVHNTNGSLASTSLTEELSPSSDDFHPISHEEPNPKLEKKAHRFSCRNCTQSFDTTQALQVHLKQVHRVVNPDRYECCFCSEVFHVKKDYHHHLIEDHGQTTSGTRRFQLCACSDCGRMFYNTGALRTHTRAVHTTEHSCQCDPCGKSFRSKKYLREHIKRLHINTNRQKKSRSKSRPVIAEAQKSVKCNLCGMSFENDRQVMGHRVRCAFFLVRPEPENENNDVTATTLGEESFVIMPKMREKQERKGKTKSDHPPYTCRHCGKAYDIKSSLNMHLSSQHSADGKNKETTVCEVCGKHVLHIGMHMKQIHLYPDLRPHMCDFCGASFKKSSALRTHRVIHTGERYPCPVCGRGFTQRGTMRKHVSTVHHVELQSTQESEILPLLEDADTQQDL